jgi:DNA-binding transcriptional LysR family regulator
MSELLAFEAAARHGSFTLAAMELGITQGAISKAVGGLERFLRLRLFTRSGSRIVLTEAGRSYLAAVTPPIAAIESATRSVMSDGGAGGRLTIAAMPSFAERWILPRLPDFARLHPRVALSFAPYTRAGDLVGGIDCAVRYGYGEWPSTESYPLLGGAPRAPETVAGLPLISHFHFPDKWPTWFETHGLPRSAAAIGTTFDQYGMIVRAVVAGLGCALVPTCLIEAELATGAVEAVTLAPYEAQRGYHLCIPTAVEPSPALGLFRDWLVREARRVEA